MRDPIYESNDGTMVRRRLGGLVLLLMGFVTSYSVRWKRIRTGN